MVGGGRSSYCASTPTLRTADFLTHRLRQEGGRACARKEGHELERRACVEAGIPLPAHRCVGGGPTGGGGACRLLYPAGVYKSRP